MFLKSKRSWEVCVPPEKLDPDFSNLQSAILIILMNDFAAKKASRDIGYFLAVTTLDNIGQGIVCSLTGSVVFPVDFTCISFKMLTGEVLDGIVSRVMRYGVFLTCGPAQNVYLSQKKMQEGYEFVPGDAPFFKKGELEIRVGTKVKFSVIAEKFNDDEKEFKVLVGLGEALGPMP